MKNKYLILPLFLIMSFAVHAQTISFTSMTSSLSGTYDFYSEVPLSATARISITGMKNSIYSYYLTVEPTIGARYLSKSGTSYKLPYTVYSMPAAPRNELYDYSGASSASQVITGDFSKTGSGSSSDTVYHDMYLIATPGTLVPSGTYTGICTVRLYRKAFKQSVTPVNKTVNVSINVPIYTELSVVPSGNIFDSSAKSATMIFSELVEGASLSLDVLAISNAPYSIAITSTKGGKLAQTPDNGQYVPYALKFAGTPVALLQGASVPAISNAPWTAGNVARYSMQVTIGTHGVLDQGTYADNLMFTISGN